MEDAAPRRGRPATHPAFDEAPAILAAAPVITGAFEGRGRVRIDPERRARLRAILAEAIGVFAWHFGLGFQLDGASSSAETGRDAGRDHGKPTLAATLGSCAAWPRRVQHMSRADAALARAGIDPAAPRGFLASHCDPVVCR